MKRYRTIVADPPWPHDRTGFTPTVPNPPGEPGDPRKKRVPYPTMTVEQIASLDVSTVANSDAHLYLWATHRFVWDAHAIAQGWGFRVVKLLTWCKPPAGFAMGGAWGNATEFCLFARRGQLPTLNRIPRDWWEWPRTAHSAKPEAFLDMVESVSPGPYVELFARRARFGWDYWGDESLNTAEMSARESG